MDEPLENWFDLRSQLVWVYDGPVNQYSRCAYDSNPVAAWFIRRGCVILSSDEGSREYFSRNWVFPGVQERWQEFSADAEILSVRFVAEWPTGQQLFERMNTITLSESDGLELIRIGSRLGRLVQRNYPGVKFELRRVSGSPIRYFELQRLFNGWMQAYTHAMTKKGLGYSFIAGIDERVRSAIHLMEMQTFNLPLRETELARKLGVSVRQINRLFVRDMGKTPVEYWEEKRTTAALRVLRESKQSIKSIAYDMGFSSLPHFSRWVKRKFGVSPREMRGVWT